jgi:NADPH-dependent 2,4-dienoyl-CoA reductase/sulfur reductase-like enzyme
MIERDAIGFRVGVAEGAAARALHAAAVIIATGAHERPFPIPGWTLPGVMTAGAAQTMLKASAIAPRGRIVLAGAGPLLYLLAAQYARLGVRVEALLDTTPSGNWREALRHVPGFLASAYARKGFALVQEVRGATHVHRNVETVSACGEERLAEVRFRQGGAERSIGADVLLLHQGVAPQINLLMAAGAEHRWNVERLAFEPTRDSCGESSIPALFVAGDTGGIGGADAAEAEGALAAVGVLQRLGRADIGLDAVETAARARLRRALRGRRFLDALFRPREAHRVPADDVIVCRCEEVTAGQIRDAVRRGARGPNQAKAFTRAGMGPCQARMCGLSVTEIIAAATGTPPTAVGYMRLRMPVKPVTVGQIAMLADAASAGDVRPPSPSAPAP